MKILVTGFNGQLGFDVIKELNRRNIPCLGADIEDFDITDKNQTENYILNYHPDCVIHCAAYTAVDNAEADEEKSRSINVEGTKNIAVACEKISAKMIYISTDYVFGGNGENPYEVSDGKNPQNIYGKTKFEGENAVKKYCKKYFIVRTSWVFGINGKNFVKTMIRLGKEKEAINVVSDQIGSPTYTPDLSKLLCDMAESDKYGEYHATNENYCSWYDFAKAIMEKCNLKAKVYPVSTEEYGAKALRPLNSRLSKKSLTQNGFSLLPDWENALDRFLTELNENKI